MNSQISSKAPSSPTSTSPGTAGRKDLFHVIHKVPAGDGPYVRAKHVQLVEKDPEAAVVLFWKAINDGDRVDSALKDMAVVMKQQDRAEEAIEAIRSFRHLCSKQAQESLDNVLIDLYKKCGRIDEQIGLLKQKLRLIYEGEVFNGKATKTARSHGKKFQVSIRQETSRVLGNLGWAYMQKNNYEAAEIVYRKAQLVDPDGNKACNLAVCLLKQGRYPEAQTVLEDVQKGKYSPNIGGEVDVKSLRRSEEVLKELLICGVVQVEPGHDQLQGHINIGRSTIADYNQEAGFEHLEEIILSGLDFLFDHETYHIDRTKTRRLPIFEEITPCSYRNDQVAC